MKAQIEIKKKKRKEIKKLTTSNHVPGPFTGSGLTDHKHYLLLVFDLPHTHKRTMSSRPWAKLPSTRGSLICKQKPDKAKPSSWRPQRQPCLLVYEGRW